MLSEQTYDKLIAMKMHGLAASFQEYLDSRESDQLPFEERFGLMVDREWAERQERRLRRRLQIARFREAACMEDINYRRARGLDRSVMQRLATCRWIAGADNVIVTGKTGVGKTWIACALGNQACRDNRSVRYFRVPRLLHSLHIARGDGTYVTLLNRLAKTDLLILDDWGLAPPTDPQRRDLLEILEDRHGRHSTIVAGQLPVKKWHEHLGEPTVADAILDRLVHRAHRIKLKGPSMRGRGEQDADE